MKYGVSFVIACVALYALAMGIVRFAAKEIVATNGVAGAVITIGAMLLAARWYDRRQEQKKMDILPPTSDRRR